MEREDILARLACLRKLDSGRQYFGARAHEYRLHSAVEAATVAALEGKHAFSLPPEYRAFVTDIGNGGAGPYYGVYPLGYEHHLRTLTQWDERLLGDLSAPFPHRDAWNLPAEFWAEEPDPPADMPPEEEDRLMQAWDARLEEHYWRRDVVSGAIPIADMGCALGAILVVTGPGAGTVWEDLRADHQGIRPATDKSGARLSFGQWYLQWLNTGISKFGGDPGALPPPPSPSYWARLFRGRRNA
jgi:hypothetical protein